MRSQFSSRSPVLMPSTGITPSRGHCASSCWPGWASRTLSSMRSTRSSTRYSSRPSLASETASGCDSGSSGSAPRRIVSSTFRRSQISRNPPMRGRSCESSESSGEGATWKATCILSARPSMRTGGCGSSESDSSGWSSEPNENRTGKSEYSDSSVSSKLWPTISRFCGPRMITSPSSEPPTMRPGSPPCSRAVQSFSNSSRAAAQRTTCGGRSGSVGSRCSMANGSSRTRRPSSGSGSMRSYKKIVLAPRRSCHFACWVQSASARWSLATSSNTFGSPAACTGAGSG